MKSAEGATGGSSDFTITGVDFAATEAAVRGAGVAAILRTTLAEVVTGADGVTREGAADVAADVFPLDPTVVQAPPVGVAVVTI
jgi:hypothetical protein